MFPSCSCLLITIWLLQLKTLSFVHIHVPSTKKEVMAKTELFLENKPFFSAHFYLYLNEQNWNTLSVLAVALSQKENIWPLPVSAVVDEQGEKLGAPEGHWVIGSVTQQNGRKQTNSRNYPCSQEVHILVPEIKISTWKAITIGGSEVRVSYRNKY